MDIEDIRKQVELNIYALKQLDRGSPRFNKLMDETRQLFKEAEA